MICILQHDTIVALYYRRGVKNQVVAFEKFLNLSFVEFELNGCIHVFESGTQKNEYATILDNILL